MSEISNLVEQIVGALYHYNKGVETALADSYIDKETVRHMQVEKWGVLIVDKLPKTGTTLVLYLVRGKGSDRTHGIMDEYLWVAEKKEFDKIGQVNYDMRDYYNAQELENLLNQYVSTSVVVPRYASDMENDVVLTESVVTEEGFKLLVDGEPEEIGASDVVRTKDIVNYWTKYETLNRTQTNQVFGDLAELLEAAVPDLEVVEDPGEAYGYWFRKERGDYPDIQ